jgi:hypothetical protein
MRLKATYEQRRAFQQAMSSMLKSIPEGGFSAESGVALFRQVLGSGHWGGSENDAVWVVWPALTRVGHQDKVVSDNRRKLGAFKHLGRPDAMR